MSRYTRVLGVGERASSMIPDAEEIAAACSETPVTAGVGEITQEDLDFIRSAVARFDRQAALDPRPDLKEDSRLWHKLLKLAYGKDRNLAGVLHGFRCMGTRIKKADGDWVLRPQVDPTGNLAWPSEAEYTEAKKKWLEPYRNEVVALLKQLKKEAG